MYIYIDDKVISAQDIIKSVIRTDCVPIPATIELVIRYSKANESLFKEGAVFSTGGKNMTFEVIHTEKKQYQLVQDNESYGAIFVTAILDGCKNVCRLKKTAIFLRDTSLSAIYKATGATAKTGKNFNVPEFSCLIGELPTEKIAKICQEEGGTLFYRDGKIEFMRLEDLVAQKPVLTLNIDNLEKEDSEFLQDHLISSFFSTKIDGSLAKGNFLESRKREFLARTPERILFNLSKCLILKRKVAINYNSSINAGDCISVNNTNMAIITAAHYYQSETTDDVEQYSRLWLGVLQK